MVGTTAGTDMDSNIDSQMDAQMDANVDAKMDATRLPFAGSWPAVGQYGRRMGAAGARL